MKSTMKCLVFATATVCVSAHAQIPGAPQSNYLVCGDRDQALENAMKRYGEVPIWTGASGNVNYFLTLSKSGSWTMFLSHGSVEGKWCMIGSGEEGQMTGGEPSEPTEKIPEGGIGQMLGA